VSNGAILKPSNKLQTGCTTAGDIGVGGREVGFMFGQYKRLRNEFTGILWVRDFLLGVH
jgi:glutamate dehydrogenase/leucine dehydrogenase